MFTKETKLLSDWKKKLRGKIFMRIYRSTIVSSEKVEKVEKWFNYSCRIYLHEIDELFVISRQHAIKI
jgi:DNA-binding LytR/AlgR family response regulator